MPFYSNFLKNWAPGETFKKNTTLIVVKIAPKISCDMLKLFGMERNLRSLKYIDSHSSIIYALLTLHMTDKKVSKKVKPIWHITLISHNLLNDNFMNLVWILTEFI